MSFEQFLCGLIALHPKTKGRTASDDEIIRRTRLAYIFRVYDLNNDGYLEAPEFVKMIRHIRHEKGEETSNQAVMDQVDKVVAAVAENVGDPGKQSFTLAEFVKAVTAGVFRGTSRLFRMSKPPY